MNKAISVMSSVCYTGYGIVGCSIVKALSKLGYSPTIFPYGRKGYHSDDDPNNHITDALERQYEFDKQAPCLNIWHQDQLAPHIGYGKYLAYPFFELDTFSKLEIQSLKAPNVLLVPSKWAANVVEQNVGRDSFVIPCGVDNDVFKPKERAEGAEQPFTFFNAG